MAKRRLLPMFTQVRVIMRTGQPRYFRAAGIEWRDVSTFEGGGAHGKGPWLVVIGESGEVVAELLKDAIRGFEIEEREDTVLREEMILAGLLTLGMRRRTSPPSPLSVYGEGEQRRIS